MAAITAKESAEELAAIAKRIEDVYSGIPYRSDTVAMKAAADAKVKWLEQFSWNIAISILYYPLWADMWR